MLDEVSLSITGGAGGRGIVSFRRERYVPRGGPDGGDGGKGGDIRICADAHLRVLTSAGRQKKLLAEAGAAGGSAKRHGRAGKDLLVKVPVGTLIWQVGEEEILLADLGQNGASVVLAKGGRGGKGNARFATATRRAPRIAEKGLPGRSLEVRLELQLLADVGLVGLPNAGKSSLLQAITQARPKIGVYPFTTVEPQLGVVDYAYEIIIVADIPGLIEGAHKGRGLGVGFLRHIKRTLVLVQVVDGASPEVEEDIETIRGELSAFGHGLGEKRWLVALNKIDLQEAREQEAVIRLALQKKETEVYSISAESREGLTELVTAIAAAVQEEQRKRAETAQPTDIVAARPTPIQPVKITKTRDGFIVHGTGPARVVEMLGVETEEARVEVARRLRRQGVATALRRKGAQPGDRIRIGGEELLWPG